MAAKAKKSILAPLLLMLLIPSVLLNIYLFITKSSNTGVAVVGVIDGDTIVLEDKVRLRLRQTDAPELNFCGGKEAKAYLTQLVSGKRVRIDEQLPDQYGRGMALVYVGNRLINLEMVTSGWVRYHHDVSTRMEDLKTAGVEAKADKRGLYGLCWSTENTVNPKCNVKGNFDKKTDEKIYYIPGCAQYKFTIVEKDIGEQYFCTEKEVREAGYKKAETCGI